MYSIQNYNSKKVFLHSKLIVATTAKQKQTQLPTQASLSYSYACTIKHNSISLC